MSEDLDAILRRVAAGELTPEEALPLIDAARAQSAPEWGTPSSTPPGAPGAPETPPVGAAGAPRAVRVAVSYRSVDVIGDPSVDQVSVTGSHSVRREGDLLVVSSVEMPGFAGVGFERAGSGSWSFMGLPRSTAWAKAMKGDHVVVRVNPALPIEIDSAAAAVRVGGCEGGARIRIVAASLKVERLRGPLDLEALTSSVKGTAAITGESRIVGESSSVKLSLLPGSDFRARTGGNRLGKLVLPGTPSAGPSGEPESVVGSGEGRLVVEGVMSSIVLTTEGMPGRASA